MTHDQECTFDPKYCSMCKLQAEARADERLRILDTLSNNSTKILTEILAEMREHEL